MTYLSAETGPLGSPVELFFFQRREVCWPYTSADSAQVFQGRTYSPHTVSRGAFDRRDEAGSSNVQVRLDRNLKVVGQFIDGSTPTPVNLTIYRLHRGDPDFIVLFRGIVANAEIQGEEVILTCVSPLSADEKSLPRHIIMRTCPHVLYGPRCAISPLDHEFTGTINSFPSATQVLVDSLPDQGADFFNAGVLYHVPTGQRAFIQDYRQFGGAEFTLLQPPIGWAVLDDILAYAGCDRKHTTCRDKFANITNFGGFPFHPERNPILDLEGS